MVRDLLAFACFALVSLPPCACSSHGAQVPPADAGCALYVSDANLSTTTSFAAAVMPVFAANCATGGGNCHGDVATMPYLGLSDGGADAARILATIVSVRSGEDPAMDFVSPGAPANSFLMHKMDGDECMFASDCAKSGFSDLQTCGETMPFLASKLPAADRDLVRAWIQQGAQNN